jgi:transposase InsO family protein
VSVSGVCRKLGITRQNYYARRQLRQRRQVDAELICGLVRQERRLQPRLGGRKLRVLLQGPLREAGVCLGRDRFFEVLRQHDLLLRPKRSEHPPTTNSSHRLPVFKNLIKERTASRPNEVWVGDLTYLRTEEGFMFLALLTDQMSRHIVGYHCSDSLESVGCQRALAMALQQLRAGEQPIHHSDRGSQYCCHEYVKLASARGLSMSMTEQDHCAENALAERMNGILKSEYGLDQRFKTKAQTAKAVDQAIHLYGTRRPHSALGHRFPAVVHQTLLPPAPPSCGLPGHWDPGARPELPTGVGSPAQVGATPVADQPVEPLRGQERLPLRGSDKFKPGLDRPVLE